MKGVCDRVSNYIRFHVRRRGGKLNQQKSMAAKNAVVKVNHIGNF